MASSELNTTHLHRLVDGLRQGDREAADRLVRAAQERMTALVRARVRNCPVLRRWVEEEDVLQNALIRLQRALLEVCPDSTRSFYNFAAEMVRREAIDLIRKLTRPEGLAANLESNAGRLEGNREPVAPAESPDELAQWADFHEAVQHLPVDVGEPFRLSYYGGLKNVEIAELLDVHEKAVARALRRARLLLAPHLDGLKA
jgi:RNA polymerase sigma-70 factor (ECF subfamily)